ncbi:tetratricopeptide repeat protein [Chitinimonas lacunae]|uniref:Tol-pal system YbgF family protein n=1 Tax=Chitinimonas lacunae TaxID=1963018 RepID=A0ABV8MTN1_9NEIS
MSILPSILHEPIEALCEQGDKLFEQGNYGAALQKYQEAETLLPSDRERWEATTWVMAALGDARFFLGDIEGAAEAFATAQRCPNGLGNAFIHLRLGQCELELMRPERALEQLAEAYRQGGIEIFEDEEDKYLDFLKTRVDLPEFSGQA